MSPAPDAALLNEHQRRYVGVTLGQCQQLLHEILALLNTPASQSGLVIEADDLPLEFARRAPLEIARIDAAIGELAERFDLPRREESRLRWIRAALGISTDDLEDTRAGSLHRYGRVDPALSAALDPAIGALQAQLRALLTLLEWGSNQ